MGFSTKIGHRYNNMLDSKIADLLSGYRMLAFGDPACVKVLMDSGIAISMACAEQGLTANSDGVQTEQGNLGCRLDREGVSDAVIFFVKSESIIEAGFYDFLKLRSGTSQKYLFLMVLDDNKGGADAPSPSSTRSYLEQICFSAGYRKHPAYYEVIEYESLNRDNYPIFIPFEKIPLAVLSEYPLEYLEEERGLHMDMTRDTGERSDAHIIRYQWACKYIKPGDRVLDAACGLGYGGHVVCHQTHAAKVVGIDGSNYAIDYATKAFPCEEGRAEYRMGMLPSVLSEYPEGSFDVIISFETLEHVEEPVKLLREFFRLLTPGGRVIVSVPNDWSDETGEDPNPFHLHVYDWGRLKSELSGDFIVEEAYAQTASQCKVSAKGGVWERRPRSLKQVALSEGPAEDCEWWLMTAMKSPIGNTLPYEEKVFANIATSGHPSSCYSDFFANPWLMHAMVNYGYRLKNEQALENLALNVMAISPTNTNDYAAALCVKAYRILDRSSQDTAPVVETIRQIDAVIATPPESAMGLRWKVSLLFIKAKLLQALGHLEQAKVAFVECASLDVRSFGIHLATKTTEAWFTAGKLAYAIGDHEEARACWARGVEFGTVLLSVTVDDILIDRSFPNRFNHGDGVREYTVSWDNIARCANGLHLLKRGGVLDYAALDNCFQTEYLTVTGDLLDCRSQLLERTEELVEARQTLTERTERLEQCNAYLIDRTRDLVETRQLLVGRTKRLEQAETDLLKRDKELVEVRQALTERTVRLEQSTADLLDRTRDLLETRQVLTERTTRLEQCSTELVDRTRDLVETRQLLIDRTELLEQASKELVEKTKELDEKRQTLKALNDLNGTAH